MIENSEKRQKQIDKKEGEMDEGSNIKAQACIIPPFYNKYLMKTPMRVIEACI